MAGGNAQPSTTATEPSSFGGGRYDEKVSQQKLKDSTPAEVDTESVDRGDDRGFGRTGCCKVKIESVFGVPQQRSDRSAAGQAGRNLLLQIPVVVVPVPDLD